jgi:hypothetical protein
MGTLLQKIKDCESLGDRSNRGIGDCLVERQEKAQHLAVGWTGDCHRNSLLFTKITRNLPCYLLQLGVPKGKLVWRMGNEFSQCRLCWS